MKVWSAYKISDFGEKVNSKKNKKKLDTPITHELF